ncbi:MAG TPA: TolC family protein [Phycisphaerales bacterium]|nr:TolC family protein [Phycisphaerales bacterium]
MYSNRAAVAALTALAAASLAGCSLTPKGTNEERARLAETGKPYEPRFEDRVLPDLPPEPTWSEVLHRAFLANGDLESAYFDWKAAVERIDVAAAWPNSRLMLGYSYTLSAGNMKAFDRSTFSFSPDSMESLLWPSKAAKQGEVALAQAREAGARFRAAKFELQRRVLSAWADYAVQAERLRIARERELLARFTLDTAGSRVRAGGIQQDLLKADVESEAAGDSVRTAEANLAAARAMLNGLLGREPEAPLSAPELTPPPRPIPVDDAVLIATAVEQNPELEALAQRIQGRADALERARLEWLPDINPMFAFTGSASQAVGAAVMLPTTIKEIEGGIKDAGAMLRGSEAVLRQARNDRAASFVATLIALRDAERQAALFESRIVPAAERIVAITRQSYSAGGAAYLDMIGSERALLDARLVVAEVRGMREKRLAELEALMGTDVETLASPMPSHAASPTPNHAPTASATATVILQETRP